MGKETDENGKPLTYWGGLTEPKEETLEKVATKVLCTKYPYHRPTDAVYWKDMFISGAKWMEEQMEELKDFDTWKEWKNKN